MISPLMTQQMKPGGAMHQRTLLASPSENKSIIPPVISHRLPNGLVLHVVEHRRLPVVGLHVMSKNGAETDPPGHEGISSLAMEGLMLGAGKRSEEEISLTLDSLGAPILSASGWDAGWIKVNGLSEDLDTLLEIVRDLALNPTFPHDPFLLLKNRRLAALKNKQQDIARMADEAFESVLFKGAPYGHSVDGTVAAVESLSAEAVRSHYARMAQAGAMAVVIVGDVRANEVVEKVQRLFSQESGAAAQEKLEISASAHPSGTIVHLFLRPGFTQCEIRIGHAGIARDIPSYHAIQVMNYIVGGGGFSSRLMEEIRVKRGYTYGISSRFKARKRPGPFVVSTFTTPDIAPDAVSIILDTVDQFRNTGATKEEMESAHGYYTGSFPLRLETPSKIADHILETELYGLGLSFIHEFRDRIRAVSLDDVHRAAREFLHPAEATIVVVGDLEKSIKSWERFGPVRVTHGTDNL